MTSSNVGTKRGCARLMALLAALLLTACGGDGSAGLPSPTGSPVASVTRTPSLPEPTRSLTGRDSEEPTASAPVTPSEAKSPSESATGTPTGSSAATEDQESGSEETAQGEVAPWAWVLLAAVGLAAVLAIVLLSRSRRRRSWQADLTAAEGEAAWFADALLPQLQQAASPDEVAGGWRVAAGRVTSIEDRLTGLEASALDDAGKAQARGLRDAVRDARHAVEGLVLVRDPMTQIRGLSSIATRLEAALARPPTR